MNSEYTNQLIEQLKDAATITAPSKPPVRPDQMLFWKAAEELERLRDLIEDQSYIMFMHDCGDLPYTNPNP